MAMSKKDFIALADEFKGGELPSEEVIAVLCTFMRRQNSAFKEDRWRDYLAGNCGPSGGEPKCNDCEGSRKAWKVKAIKDEYNMALRLCTKCCDSRKQNGWEVTNS